MRPPRRRTPLVAIVLAAGLTAVGLHATTPAQAAAGDIADFPVPDAAAEPQHLMPGPGTTLVATLRGSGLLAQVTAAGVITTGLTQGATIPGAGGIALGPDGRLWVTETPANRIAAVSPTTGQVTRYPVNGAGLGAITTGPDGALWFTLSTPASVGRMTTAGAVTLWPLASATAGPAGIAAGPDGSLWATLRAGNAIARITTAGVITEFPLPTAGAEPAGIVAGPDGALWFTQVAGNRIGRITTAGAITEFALGTAGSQPTGITSGPDGSLWFTETGGNRIGRITTAGVITEFPVPTANAAPTGIAAGADGNVWFTQPPANRIGRILTGVIPVVSTTAPPAVTSAATASGSTLSASTGTWSWAPTSYAYQWQRCATADTASCTTVAGAVAATYAVPAADAGVRFRVLVTATNANGPSTAAASAVVTAPAATPTAPPALTPVSGGQSVVLGNSVVATVKGPKRPRAGKLKWYGVRLSNPSVRGTVRISLVDARGIEVAVIVKGRNLKATGRSGRYWRAPASLAPGTYTLQAIVTPRADQAVLYAVGTMRKPISIRR